MPENAPLTTVQPALTHARRIDEAQRVLHVVRAAGRSSFGVGEIVRSLVHAQADQGHAVSCWSTDTEDELRSSGCDSGPQASYTRFATLGPRRLGFSPAMMQSARASQKQRFSIVHQHSLWSACSAVTLQWATRHACPTVVAPHGALDPWCMQRSRFKKSISLALVERRNLHEASCLHATGEQEAQVFRDFGLTNPIAFIPNGVSQQWTTSTGNAQRFRSKFGLGDDRRVMLFLSRVTPKKGLPMFLQAMAQRRSLLDDWTLAIAGPDEFGHAADVHGLAADLGLQDHVKLLGSVFDQDRRDAFEAADLFVLPTHGEGNPMVVFEALGVGVPVLTTRGAPCPYLVDRACGWRSEISSESLAAELDDALGASDRVRREMGSRGRELMMTEYSWETAAAKLLVLYRWLQQGGPAPDFVQLF
ncbi:MAG: glycosyltransferase [Planctomycetota bacterium]